MDELNGETDRLTDWREYVRSAPLLAIAGSAVLGVVLGRFLFGTRVQVRPFPPPSVPFNDRPSNVESGQAASKAGIASRVVAFALPILVTVAQRRLASRLASISTCSAQTTPQNHEPAISRSNDWRAQ